MRHAHIDTTMKYYTKLEASDAARWLTAKGLAASEELSE